MLRSRLPLWLSIFVFPPLGLVLLWMRGDLCVWKRIAATLGIAVIELFYVYGMRVVWNGALAFMTAAIDNGLLFVRNRVPSKPALAPSSALRSRRRPV